MGPRPEQSPPPGRPRRGLRAALLGAALGLLTGVSSADATGPESREGEDPGPVTDPNDAEFMKPPNGQLRTWSAGKPEPITRGFSGRRRFQLTVLPTYAAVRMPLFGRTSSSCGGGFACTPVRGFGAAVEADLRVLRWLWVRLGASHTVHPVDDNFSVDDDGEVSQLARAGNINTTTFGLSLVYPIDLGRFMPLLDGGVGGMLMNSPEPAINGQQDAPCRDGGVCDPGLACAPDNMCRLTVVPEAHVGLGLDVLLGRHWSVGAQVRYHALLSSISVFPTYLVGALRLAARF